MPALYHRPSGAFRCLSPPGVDRTVVNLWLEESGRQVGMAAPLFWTYNDSAPAPVSEADVEQVTCHDCAGSLPAYCPLDCTGTYRGNATVDACGVCRPPAQTGAVITKGWVATAATFPYTPVTDCMGVCYGPFTAYNHTALPAYDPSVLPQCGCTIRAEPQSLQSLAAFPYTTLCAVWQRVAGAHPLRDTVSSLKWYQVFVFTGVGLTLFVALVLETLRYAKYVRRRLRMTPAERARERRRMERRRQRERDRRERRRRLALGLPLPNQEVLPPGVAAVPVVAEAAAAGAGAPAAAAAGGGAGDGTGLRQRVAVGPVAAPQLAPTGVAGAIAWAVVGARPTGNVAGSGGWDGGLLGQQRLSASESAALQQLHTMGFNDDAVLLPLIRRCRGDVSAALNQLLR